MKKSYATMVGLCRGLYADFFFLAFFGAGPELSEDPAREDSVAACFRSGPLGPLVLGGTSCTWPSGSADVEDSGYENAIGQGSCTSKIMQSSSSSDQSDRKSVV